MEATTASMAATDHPAGAARTARNALMRDNGAGESGIIRQFLLDRTAL
jgi:hypothetical protein